MYLNIKNRGISHKPTVSQLLTGIPNTDIMCVLVTYFNTYGGAKCPLHKK